MLVNSIKKVVAEEGEKINMKIKIVETAGPSLALILTRPKLRGCIFPDCDFEDNGVDHLRHRANYTGTCNVDPCEDRYRGESRFGGHARIDGRGGHEDDIRLKHLKNSTAQQRNSQKFLNPDFCFWAQMKAENMQFSNWSYFPQ